MTTALHLPSPWPEGDVAELRRLWLSGCSKTEIAFRMNRTLGQVSGKIDRMRDELQFRNAKAAARNQGQLMAKRWVELRRELQHRERAR
ncbi:MAG: hypothetical protein ACK4SQ_16125 [Allorhizobium sp.]